MQQSIESEWQRLAARCDEQTAEWERVRGELRALATEALTERLRVPADDELLAAFDDATEIKLPPTSITLASGALSMMRG